MSQWTDELIQTLPINGGWRLAVDSQTGILMRIPRPQRFIVTDDDTYCVTNRTTHEQWRIGLDVDGEYWKERL